MLCLLSTNNSVHSHDQVCQLAAIYRCLLCRIKPIIFTIMQGSYLRRVTMRKQHSQIIADLPVFFCSQLVQMETSGLLVGQTVLRVGWRSAVATNGAPCVMTLGEFLTLMWPVDSLDSLQQVGFFWDGCLLHVLSADFESHFLPTDATAFSSATFGQGTGPILLDNVACSGSEARLFDCSNLGIGVHNCDHSEDAGVRCQSTYNFLRNQSKVLCYGSVLMILTHNLVVQPPVSLL